MFNIFLLKIEEESMANVVLKEIYKKYEKAPDFTIKGVSMEIKDEEFMIFLGPSGCGKTTTLRMIAGLEEITQGEIEIDNTVVNNLPPKDRNIAMVFQNYALYPHMSIYENMAFGLKLRKVPKSEIDKKVKEAAMILGIEDLLSRKPKQLSGGQRQRVALGRAIVRNPKVFLMDEPLSNLDAKLRVQMRAELSKLHKQLSTTFIYVTHDQVEAMTMGDRIAIFNNGVIQQLGKPTEIYNHPANKFVAGFIGNPPMNFLKCKVMLNEKKLATDKFFLELSDEQVKKLSSEDGKQVYAGVRPEDFTISNEKHGIKGSVELVETLGAENHVYLKIDNESIILKFPADISISEGETINAIPNIAKLHVFDFETGVAFF
jgi:multiple sugar transport system ATP-binding protein